MSAKGTAKRSKDANAKDAAAFPTGKYYFVKAAERPVKAVETPTHRRPRVARKTIQTQDPGLAQELRRRLAS